jgi:segregation and condensation protein A
MFAQNDYKVRLEIFEGPLDLLLYLIKVNEIDIYNIPIEKIISQYMEYLELMRMLDLNIAGEFLVMAATLLAIKSRMLLPPEQRPVTEDEEPIDPRWDLVRQLIEYKKFKDLALRLREKESHQINSFPPGVEGAVPVREENPGLALQDISIFDLISAFREVLKRAQPEKILEIEGHKFTVPDRMDAILQIVAQRQKLLFHELFGEQASRQEILCTFLALLELIRLRQIIVRQEQRFGDIIIEAIPATTG